MPFVHILDILRHDSVASTATAAVADIVLYFIPFFTSILQLLESHLVVSNVNSYEGEMRIGITCKAKVRSGC